jgi:hypothetical protein
MSASPAIPASTLDANRASAFARVALANVVREYPNKLDHVLNGAADVASPRALHPAFYGSFDWHSCVHMHWLLARVARRFPTLAEAPAIVATLDAHLSPANVAAELAYLAQPSRATFERTYGWAWLLKLAAELKLWRADFPDGPASRWDDALAPLAQAFAARFVDHLPRSAYPIRAGTHANGAFALDLALDYAQAAPHAPLDALVRSRARDWFTPDAAYPARYEPSGDDFLSGGLMEAALMQRVLAAGEFAVWLDRFVPDWSEAAIGAWLAPPRVSDRTDAKIVHLDGLSLSRAWCWRRLARAFDSADPRRALALTAAARHLDAGLPQVVGGDYVGEHWLASFAVLALIG